MRLWHQPGNRPSFVSLIHIFQPSMIHSGPSILTWVFPQAPPCLERKRIRKYENLTQKKISKRFWTRLWLCKFSSPNEASEIQALVSSGEYSVYFTVFSHNYWAWIELTLTEEVYYWVKNVIRYYSVLKNDSGMTAATLYKVHRITSFAQVFNIMSRRFSVATVLLWQHVSLNMTQYNS